MSKISIVLTDDHQLIRDTWSFLLNSEPEFKVVATASSGEEAIELTRQLRPAVVLMDVNMTPLNGIETTAIIRKNFPSTRVIGVSMHSLPAYARQMFKAGATGYITKNSPKEELLIAIREVNKGNKFICNEVKNILLQYELNEPPTPQSLNKLSPREIDVAKMVRKGYGSKEIAGQLNIALKTVEVHRYNILKKLNIKNSAALVNLLNTFGI